MSKKRIISFLFIFAFVLYPSILFAEDNQESTHEIITSLTKESGVQIVKIQGERGKNYVVRGNLELNDNISIHGNLIVYGDIKIGSFLNVSGHILSMGDIELGNNAFIGGTLKGKNILIGSSARVKRIVSHGNLELKGQANIIDGVYVKGDFDAGSELKLFGSSKILGNMTVGPYSTIGGTLYVYKSMKTSFNFDFDGEKLKVLGDFKTLQGPDKWSSLTGRIHIIGNNGHKYIYGNRVVFLRYFTEFSNFEGLIGKIDPILKYKLKEHEISHIQNVVLSYRRDIQSKQRKIVNISQKNPESRKLLKKKQEIYQTFHTMFQFISKNIEKESWDQIKFKEIQLSESSKLKSFLHQFHGDINYIELDEQQDYGFITEY